MKVSFSPLDKDSIGALVLMMQQFYAIDNYPMDAAKSAGLCETFLADENLGRAWFIEYNGELAGYILLTFIFSFEYGGRIAFLDELFILPQMQGNGLGKRAVDFVKLQAVPLDIKIFYLEVENHNNAAIALYISKGFTMHNRSLMKYKV
jgi:ribosomal protein S18 acetylase RimI-like enzyme